MVKTFAARRGVRLQGEVVPSGTLLPEAKTWFRLDNIIHSGNITVRNVTEDELLAAIDERCPELKEQLLKLYGLDPDVYPTGPRGSLREAPPKPARRKRAARSAPVAVKAKPAPRKRVATKA